MMNNFNFSGTVIEGKKRGKSLGYPTANVALDKPISQGIYISEIVIDDVRYPALTFIGDARTFGDQEVLSETYVLSFDQDIYGKQVNISLLKKIRENMKFESAEKLVEQMKQDEEEAQEYFEKNHL